MYAQAAIPDPYRILGLRLRPFSLGHYLLLQRFGCRFIEDDKTTVGRDDLILGVLICSRKHREFLEFIETDDFTQHLRDWGKKVSLFDFPAKARLFASYLQESLKQPEHTSIKPGDDRGDWAQNLKMTLMTRLNHTEETALDMPLSQALADYYNLAESEGLIRLITPEDIAAGQANADALAQWQAALQSGPKNEEAACPG